MKSYKVDVGRHIGVSHPVSRNFETHIPDISSKNMANPASRKSPAGPLEVESGNDAPRYCFICFHQAISRMFTSSYCLHLYPLQHQE